MCLRCLRSLFCFVFRILPFVTTHLSLPLGACLPAHLPLPVLKECQNPQSQWIYVDRCGNARYTYMLGPLVEKTCHFMLGPAVACVQAYSWSSNRGKIAGGAWSQSRCRHRTADNVLLQRWQDCTGFFCRSCRRFFRRSVVPKVLRKELLPYLRSNQCNPPEDCDHGGVQGSRLLSSCCVRGLVSYL